MNGSKWISPKRRLAIYLRDGFTCMYCDKDLHGANPQELTLDHFKPVSKGGSHRSDNLVTCCARCNVARRNRPVRTYLKQTQPVDFFIHNPYTRIQNQRRKNMTKYLAQAKRLIGGSRG